MNLGELADFLGANAGAERLQHFNAAGHFVFEHDDDVVDPDFARRFDRLPVDGDAAMTAGIGGDGACFEDAHSPEPFVQSDCGIENFRHREERATFLFKARGKNAAVQRLCAAA